MTYRDIAQLIPAHIRKEIIQRNVVALASDRNEFMLYLFETWKLYVDSAGSLDWECGYCRANIKENFTKILPDLIELQKEQNLLDAI